MKLKQAFLVSTLAISLSAGLNATAVAGEDKAAAAQKAIETAQSDLSKAQAAGSVWQLIDPATGSGSAPLDKLLGAAIKKQEAGDYDEAIRIADRVSEAALLGLEQAESQKGNVEPFYN